MACPVCQLFFIERVMNGLKKSAKNRGSQWHAQSAHLTHTGHVKGSAHLTHTVHVKGKCGFSGRSWDGPSIHIWPYGAGYFTERVVNGLKKSAKK